MPPLQLLASSAFAAKASANPAPVPQKWDEEVDVIVVGSGFAGLAAAYEAAKAGSKVIILEKCRLMAATPSSTAEK